MTDTTTTKPPVNKWRNRTIKALIFIVVIAGFRAWQQRDMVSGPAPALQGMTLAGQPYQLAAHRDGPVMVHFWATWCPICKTEQDSINTISHDDANVITIAMNSGKSEEVVKHMQEEGIDFPVVNDPDSSISNAWGVHAVPASFIISPSGQIRFAEVGFTTGLGMRLRLWLAGLF